VAPRRFADGNAPADSLDRGTLIGARLRHRRLELGMTARELARRVDCSPSLEVCYPVGQSVPEAEHAIQHTGQEYAVIVEGALSTQIGFEQYVLEEGDSLTFDSAIPHRFWNAGTVPARAIWVILNRSR
jgi:mannose-6-phosphate isomerase-like protein (cupin superfamily)